MESKFFPTVVGVLASIPGDGMCLEAVATGRNGEQYPRGESSHFMLIRAEVEGTLHAVFQTEGGSIEIPVEELERVIQDAKKEVHSEDYFG